VNYLAFGLPALAAGEVISAAELEITVVAYGALIMIGAVTGLRNEINMGRSERNSLKRGTDRPLTRERNVPEWQGNELLSWAVPQE
jgi:hypothetical protein